MPRAFVFMQYLDDLNRSQATKNLYLFWLEKLAKIISKPYEDMTSEDLAQFIHSLKKLKPASRNMARNKIHYFFTKFLKLPEVVEHPTLSKEDVPIESPNLLTENEIRSLIGAAKNQRDKALIAVLIEGGMRVGALSEFPKDSPARQTGPGYMTFGDVEKYPHGYKIHIRHTKTREERYVPILFYAADLKQWLTLHPTKNDKDPLWCYQQEGKLNPLSYEAIYRLVSRSAQRAGIKKRVHPHLLRKQFASTMKEKYDLDSWDIAQLGGWVPNSSTLRRYIHQNPNAVHDRYAKRLGIKEQIEEPEGAPVRKECLMCGEVLSPTSKYCPHCGQIQDRETVEIHREAIKENRRVAEQYREEIDLLRQQQTKQRQQTEQKFKELEKLFNSKELIQEQKFSQRLYQESITASKEVEAKIGSKITLEDVHHYFANVWRLVELGEMTLDEASGIAVVKQIVREELRKDES